MKTISTIVTFGGTSTRGIGAPGVDRHSLTWRWKLDKKLNDAGMNSLIIDSSLMGDTTAGAADRFADDVLYWKPDAVLICFGMSDAFLDEKTSAPAIPLAAFRSNIQKIVAGCKGAGALPILVSPNPQTPARPGFRLRKLWREKGVNFLLKKYVGAIRKLAHENDVPFIDVYRAFERRENYPDMLPDGYLPDLRGTELIARTIFRHFKKNRPPARVEEKRTRIVVFGCSVTEGAVVGAGPFHLSMVWRNLLDARLNETGFPVLVINAGVGGDNAFHAHLRIDGDVFFYKPDYLVIMFGLNDGDLSAGGLPNIDISLYRERIRRFVEMACEKGVRAVLATPTPYGKNKLQDHIFRQVIGDRHVNFFLDDYADTVRDVARQMGAPLVDINKKFKDLDDYDMYLPDGVHYNREGNEFIAQAFAEFFERELKG